MQNLGVAQDYRKMKFGGFGSRYLSGVETGTTGEVYRMITALSATVVTLEQPNGETTLTSLPIPAGATIVGEFTSITMVSGDILAYIG